MLSHFKSNLIAYLALFIALGGSGAYAAVNLKKNSVASKQLKNGGVKPNDLANGAVSSAKVAPGAISSPSIADGSIIGGKLADGAVTGAKVADGSLTGDDIDEATLTGLSASALENGMQVKRIHFLVPFGTTLRSVVDYPGVFRINAQCVNGGDFVDVSAATNVDNSVISKTSQRSTIADDRSADANRDIASANDFDFDSNEVFEVDNTDEIGAFNDTTVHYANPDGFVAFTQLKSEFDGAAGCKLTGISIGG